MGLSVDDLPGCADRRWRNLYGVNSNIETDQMRDRTQARSSIVTLKSFDENLIHDTVMASGIRFTRDLLRSICSTCVCNIFYYSACPVLLCHNHTLKVGQPHAAETNLIKATGRGPSLNRLHKLRTLITPGESDN